MGCGPVGSSVFTDGAGDLVPCTCRHVLTWGPDRKAISNYLQDKYGSDVPLYPFMPIISDPRALTEFTAWTDKRANTRGVAPGPHTRMPNMSALICSEADLQVPTADRNMLWQQRISDMEMVISTVSGSPSPPRVLLMPLDPHAVAAFR